LLVVVAIVGLLLGILTPSLVRVREMTKMTVCKSNLKRIAEAIMAYAALHDDYIVPAYSGAGGAVLRDGWAANLVRGHHITAPKTYHRGTLPDRKSIFRCPSGVDHVNNNAQPRSHADGKGADAVTHQNTIGQNFFVHAWYGCNGSRTDSSTPSKFRYPFRRGRPRVRATEVDRPSDTVCLFDGNRMHNGQRRFINARHMGRERTNLLFFDGRAADFDTFSLFEQRVRLPNGQIEIRDPLEDATTTPTFRLRPF